MAGNTIGQLFRVTTFGESHGIALGCIVDGVPPNLELSEADIQPDLSLDVGMDIFHRGLCLPSDNKMTVEQQDQIIEVIKECYKKSRPTNQ